jgi:hypothetical protein
MAFGYAGFDEDALMTDFEERLPTKSIRRQVLCKLITFLLLSYIKDSFGDIAYVIPL